MLKNIPVLLSPDLLKYLDEMGHNDLVVIGDASFPGSALARSGGASIVRADGAGAAEMLRAVLSVFPLDTYVEKPVTLMEKEPQDKDIAAPLWEAFSEAVAEQDARGRDAIGFLGRMDFYEQAKSAYVIIQTTETGRYGCLMLRKGVILL